MQKVYFNVTFVTLLSLQDKHILFDSEAVSTNVQKKLRNNYFTKIQNARC